jgi:3-dehydroquinate dehydratase
VNQLAWLSGQRSSSLRDGYLYWMGPELYGVKWRNFKLAFVAQQYSTDPVGRLSSPRIINLVADPHEREPLDLPYMHSWTVTHFNRLLDQFQASIAREPPVPPRRPARFRPIESTARYTATRIPLTRISGRSGRRSQPANTTPTRRKIGVLAARYYEGQLIDWIHETGAAVRAGESIGAVFNPGAFTHTSVALHDAIEGASLPLIECHISNVHKREEFRHHSFISPVASGIIVGFGVHGYVLAIHGLHPAVTGRLTGSRLSRGGPRPRRPGQSASPPLGRDDQSSALPAQPPGTAARSDR